MHMRFSAILLLMQARLPPPSTRLPCASAAAVLMQH